MICCNLCSTAGARSGKYAAQLGKEGFSNVRNMKGSLVSWVRHGSAARQNSTLLAPAHASLDGILRYPLVIKVASCTSRMGANACGMQSWE